MRAASSMRAAASAAVLLFLAGMTAVAALEFQGQATWYPSFQQVIIIIIIIKDT
jgi:hypothetical protein